MKNFILATALLISTAAFSQKAAAVKPAAAKPSAQSAAAQPKAETTIQFLGANGTSEFSATGKPAMIKINGKGPGPEGVLTYAGDKISGTVKVDLTKLTTEIDLRDEHMKNKYLEVQKFPMAEITFKEFKLPKAVDSITDDVEIAFTGDFTMHGKTKPISGTAKVKKSAKSITGQAEFTIKIMEYLETLPSYAGIKVAEDVKVKIKMSGTVE